MLECESGVKIQDNTVATLTLKRCCAVPSSNELALTSPSASWLEMKCQEGCQRVTCELSIDPTFPLPDARDHMCDGCKHGGRIQDWFNAKTSSSGINKHPSGSSVCIILSIHDTVVHSWINSNHGTRTESCGNRELKWWNHVTWMTDLNPPAFAQRSKSSPSNSAGVTVILAQKVTQTREEEEEEKEEQARWTWPNVQEAEQKLSQQRSHKSASPPLIRTSMEASPAGLSQGCRHSGNNQICLGANHCFVGERLHPGRRHVILQRCSRERGEEVISWPSSASRFQPVNNRFWSNLRGAELLLMQQIRSKCFHTHWQHQSASRLWRILELLARAHGRRLIHSSQQFTFVHEAPVRVPAKLTH